MSAWSHFVRVIPPRTADTPSWARDPECGYRAARSRHSCPEMATHTCGYRYVSGRAGNVSTSERHRCEHHAREFALRHGVEFPEAVAR